MKRSRIILTVFCVICLSVFGYLNHRTEAFVFHPFYVSDDADLKVMTWNVHCPEGAELDRQRKIAEAILEEDADFVLLNEYYQDSCAVIDAMLKQRYPYTEEYQSHQKVGDIFYSKQRMSNSGHVWIPEAGKSIQTIKATIAVGLDSVQIFGVHMASNNKSEIAVYDSLDTEASMFVRYKGRQASRKFQASWTAENVKESQHPVIVMGDMNDFSFSLPLTTLYGSGLVNSWTEGGFGFGNTFHSGWMHLRIDHILHSDGLRLTDIRVINTGNLSDHRPAGSIPKYEIMHIQNIQMNGANYPNLTLTTTPSQLGILFDKPISAGCEFVFL